MSEVKLPDSLKPMLQPLLLLLLPHKGINIRTTSQSLAFLLKHLSKCLRNLSKAPQVQHQRLILTPPTMLSEHLPMLLVVKAALLKAMMKQEYPLLELNSHLPSDNNQNQAKKGEKRQKQCHRHRLQLTTSNSRSNSSRSFFYQHSHNTSLAVQMVLSLWISMTMVLDSKLTVAIMV
jgi:hypothetical protein